MDIEVTQSATQPTRFSPFISFFDVSNNFPWQEPRPEQIRLRRSMMDDCLLFDILLRGGGMMETYSLYPPEGQQGLQTLLDAIANSTYDTLKKDCMVYFLLKWHQDGRERNFQHQRCIPPQFTALADAYWYLDTGISVHKAVAILSDLRLNRDHVSKIIRAISLSPDFEPLIRRYVQTTKPPLVEPLDIECYTFSLADSSVLEAWQYSRTFDDTENMRTRLFKKILEWSVTPKPRPNALKQLLALPLSSSEESILNEFVQKPPSTLKSQEVAILQDLVCVRLIQGGRYSEAIKLDHHFTSSTAPKNLKLTRDRSAMVKEVYTALPSVERALLELELDPTVPKPVPLTPKPATPRVRRAAVQEPQDSPLSQSWEEVHVPDTLVNKSTPLKDVRVPMSTPIFGNSSLRASTSASGAPPVIPINLTGVVNGSTPRKSLPLTSSVMELSQPRSLLSGAGNRMASSNGSVMESPVSGMRITHTQTPQQQGHAFVSASRQPNAFYQPPPVKTNELKRSFEEDLNKSSERESNFNISAVSAISGDTLDAEVDVEGDKEQEQEQEDSEKEEVNKVVGGKGQINVSDDEERSLHYSVFKDKQTTRPAPISVTASKRPSGKRQAPPGAFASEEEDAGDDEHEPSISDKKRFKSAVTTTTSRARKSEAAVTKPPMKKARKIKEKGQLSRSIPGALMDEEEEEEEEDRVAPLPSPQKKPVRKSRSSVSVEMSDDFEGGPKTRRRSSRLTAGGSGNISANSGGSPEAVAKRRSTRASGGPKKKR